MALKRLETIDVRELFGRKVEQVRWECECGCVFAGFADEQNGKCSICRLKDERVERPNPTVGNIPPRYQWATLDAPELSQRVAAPGCVVRAREAVDRPAVVLLGIAGSGKTSLAAAILRAMASRRGVVGRFETAFGLAKARQEHKLGDGEAPRVQRAAEAKLLLLDELGAELGRNTAVQEVIHERHANELPTIYTSGFSAEELRVRYGEGIERRIFEGAVTIRCSQ